MIDGFVYAACPNLKCGVGFYIPKHIDAQAREQGKSREVCCPNGHTWWYLQGDIDKLRQKVEDLEKSVKNEQEHKESNWRRYVSALRTLRYWKGIAHRKKK